MLKRVFSRSGFLKKRNTVALKFFFLSVSEESCEGSITNVKNLFFIRGLDFWYFEFETRVFGFGV